MLSQLVPDRETPVSPHFSSSSQTRVVRSLVGYLAQDRERRPLLVQVCGSIEPFFPGAVALSFLLKGIVCGIALDYSLGKLYVCSTVCENACYVYICVSAALWDVYRRVPVRAGPAVAVPDVGE